MVFNSQTWNFANSNEHYGFTVGIKIPNYAPRGSLANFTIEFGYDQVFINFLSLNQNNHY